MESIKENKHSEEQAKAQFDCIAEMVENLLNADDNTKDDARQRINENALEVQVRADWHTPGSEEVNKPTEYTILLCTGGPAVRIIGDLNKYLEPETATIQHQDWFTPWEDYLPTGSSTLTDEQEDTLLIYARCFWCEIIYLAETSKRKVNDA